MGSLARAAVRARCSGGLRVARDGPATGGPRRGGRARVARMIGLWVRGQIGPAVLLSGRRACHRHGRERNQLADPPQAPSPRWNPLPAQGARTCRRSIALLKASTGCSCEMAVSAESVLDHSSLEAIAREVAQLLGRDDQPGARGMLTARQVAARFNVERGWVYAHADELGVVRLGRGPRPRLRFDPAVVAQHLLARSARAAAAPSPSHVGGGAPLLPIKSSRRMRTLDPNQEACDGTKTDGRSHRARA